MDDLATRVAAFLDAHHVMSLATVGPEGAPHAASVFYARDGFTLYWTSDPASRHSQHLARAPRVAATIAPDYADFRDILGLQIAGRAARLAAGADAARACLVGRYAFLAALADGPATLRAAFAAAAFYALTIEEATLIDNTIGFGHKETLRALP